jgi:hypothetical protein
MTQYSGVLIAALALFAFGADPRAIAGGAAVGIMVCLYIERQK